MSGIIFAGTPEVAIPALDAFVAAGVEVAAVLTRPDAPLGRKRVLTPSPVAARAAELGLPIIKASRVTAEVVEELAATGAVAGAVVAYGALLPQPALDILKHGWVNLHFSLLPEWRGAAPVQRAIINGDEFLGATAFVLDAGMDTGPILGTMVEKAAAEETSGSALSRLAVSGAPLLVQSVLGLIQGQIEPRAQEGAPSHAAKLTIDDGHLNWHEPAISLDRRLRGVTPEPGAWTTLDSQRFKIGTARPVLDVSDLSAGQVSLTGKRVLVGTGSGALELLQVQPAGKKMMAAADWARGALQGGTVNFE